MSACLTLRDAIEDHATTIGLSRRSTQKLRHHVNSWERRVGKSDDLFAITTDDVTQFRQVSKTEGLSAATIEGCVTDLLAVLRFHGHIVHAGRRLKKRPPRPFQPTPEQIGQFYQHVHAVNDKHKPWPHWCDRLDWWKAWIALSFWTGLRLGDVRRMTWDSIQGDVLSLDAHKTGTYQSFPIPAFLHRHLEPLRGRETVFGMNREAAHINAAFDRGLIMIRKSSGLNITAQRLRRASITAWTVADGAVGSLVHGSGLPRVLRHYLDPAQLIKASACKFAVPDVFLTPEERANRKAQEKRLLEAFRLLNDDKKTIALNIVEGLRLA